MVKDIVAELKKHNILGRSGSGFPTAIKWELVKNQKADKRYIICNGSEGEPDNYKDKYILKHYPDVVILGVIMALKTLRNSKAYIYLKKDYYWRYARKLKKLSKNYLITVLKKKGGYLAGEETSICEAIEGNRPEPRQRPPFVSQSGLWGCPTLVNNIETFYCVGKITEGKYENERFYTLSGEIKRKGVFKLSKDLTIKEILEKTKNYPKFNFFVQAGGGAMGEILLPEELDKKIEGIGSIVVYDKKKTNPLALMQKWASFFLKENCDKCTPCREGIYRINEILKNKKLDKQAIEDILFVMKETSFCPLGKNAYKPFQTLMEKIIK
jgi:NADH:ubiquinone oxidoreductase subunit F (NADH-binding)